MTSDRTSACQRQRVKFARALANSGAPPMLSGVTATPAAASRSERTSNSVRETNTAVKTFASRPIASVVAKPRIGRGAELKQERRGDQRRDMRVDDGQPDAREGGLDCRPRAMGRGELLLDPLEDQHVRIDAHADRQNQARRSPGA